MDPVASFIWLNIEARSLLGLAKLAFRGHRMPIFPVLSHRDIIRDLSSSTKSARLLGTERLNSGSQPVRALS